MSTWWSDIPEYSLEGLILRLKFQYFGNLMRRANSLEKILMLWKIEDRGEGDNRGWDGWIINSMDTSLSKLQETVKDRETWRAAVHEVTTSQTRLRDWTAANTYTQGRASLVAQMVKNLPPKQEIWVRSLGQEDTLEKGIATHFSFLAWRIPCTKELDGL